MKKEATVTRCPGFVCMFGYEEAQEREGKLV